MLRQLAGRSTVDLTREGCIAGEVAEKMVGWKELGRIDAVSYPERNRGVLPARKLPLQPGP